MLVEDGEWGQVLLHLDLHGQVVLGDVRLERAHDGVDRAGDVPGRLGLLGLPLGHPRFQFEDGQEVAHQAVHAVSPASDNVHEFAQLGGVVGDVGVGEEGDAGFDHGERGAELVEEGAEELGGEGEHGGRPGGCPLGSRP